MLRFRLLVIGSLLALLAVDTASAGLFGLGRRRWERRKAELRGELVSDLSYKMDQDLAREVDAIKAKLTETAQQQIQVEGEKLQQQVDQALAQLRDEAAKTVAAEVQRLDKKIDDQVEQLKQQAQATVQAESKKLKDQTDKQIDQLNAKFAEQSQALKSTVEQEIAKLPTLLSQQVAKVLEQQQAKKLDVTPAPGSAQPQDRDSGADSRTPDQHGNQPSKVSASQPSALTSKEVELAEASVADGH